jgi:hypothetical protein
LRGLVGAEMFIPDSLCFELKSKFNVFFVAALVRFLLVQSH